MTFFSPAFGWYAHPPKTGGLAFRQYLIRKFDGGEEIGDFHGIPYDTMGYPIITTVRHPVRWMRSVYSYRKHQYWTEKYDGLGWYAIVGMTQWGKNMEWEKFVDRIYKNKIDIPYVIFGMFASSAYKVYKIEDMEIEITNMTPGKPPMRAEEREKLEETFQASLERWDYREKP